MSKSKNIKSQLKGLEEFCKQHGRLETPLYPFRAGKVRYFNLSGKSDIPKYGAHRFSQKEKRLIKEVFGHFPPDISELKNFLVTERNVQNPKDWSWRDILTAMKKYVLQKQKTFDDLLRKVTDKEPASKQAQAMVKLYQHPEWSDKQIAAAIRVNVKSVYRWPDFMKAKELLMAGKEKFRRYKR